MRYLITGAHGFVMSVLMRRLLDTDPTASVTALDLERPGSLQSDFLGPLGSRVDVESVDVRDRDALWPVVRRAEPDVVVHGATVTHVPAWELADPVRYVDVNVLGTAQVLDCARRVGTVRRVVHVSSAAVYGDGGQPGAPVDEETPTRPDETYGVSKAAGEMVARRFGTLYDLPVSIVRLTKMFGPMERPTGARSQMSLPFHLARALIMGERLRVTRRTLDACGDWLNASDAARLLGTLAAAPGPLAGPYNVASGRLAPVGELASLVGADLLRPVHGETAEFDMDPAATSGKNGTYAIARARADLQWEPRDLSEQVHDYVAWARANPRCLTG